MGADDCLLVALWLRCVWALMLADFDVNVRGLLGRVSLLCRHSPYTLPTIALILFTQITIEFYCILIVLCYLGIEG
jgi:hypothetical protein